MQGVSPCGGDKSSPVAGGYPDKSISFVGGVGMCRAPGPEEGLAEQPGLGVDLEPQRWSLA